MVQSCKEVEAVSQRIELDMALLDAELHDQPFAETARRLMEQFPHLKLIVFPPDNNPQHPEMAGLRPHACMNKPFYLPDLVEVIESLLTPATPGNSPPQPSPPGLPPHNNPPWLQDVNTAAQHLTRLLLESSAQAALITRRAEIWAYAGHLDQPTAQQVATVMGRAWDKYARTDLARFVRMENGGEFLVYATSLFGEMVLAMVYDVSMPLTRIRSQAGKLARALASSATTAPLPALDEPDRPAPEEEPLEGPDLSEQERFDILSLLADMPSPDPDPQSPPVALVADEWQPEKLELPAPSSPAAAATSAPETEVQEVVSFIVEEEPTAAAPEETRPAQLDGLEETRPIQRPSAHPQPMPPAQLSELDPAAPGLSYLAYTCILLPRFQEHFLTGELALQLGQWLPELCIAFGWRLEGIAIRPDYLQWTLRVPPAISPGGLVRTLRQQTSLRVFQAFPHLKNPAEDFWAPGYLILSGAQPPAADLLHDYMEQTRRRQGKSARRKSAKESPHAPDSVSN